MMEPKANINDCYTAKDSLPEVNLFRSERTAVTEIVSVNEAVVPLEFKELAPHIRVVKPSRPSVIYDRIE